MNAQDVLAFWFNDENQKFWFAKSDTFDQQILARFGQAHQRARQGELWDWRSQATGRLAEIIILDQFSRNLFRDQAEAFAQDAMALALAQEAISLQLDQQLEPMYRRFLYMPFMHSESLAIHDLGYKLFEQLEDASTLSFEQKHRDIIVRFGRYPHRNAILGRTSTAEEIEFLTQPNSSF